MVDARSPIRAIDSGVGVIATTCTIHSRCHPNLINELQRDFDVFVEPSEKLAALIEQGDFTDEAIDAEISAHVHRLLNADPEICDIALGCTRYPIVEKLFQENAPHVALLNPAEAQPGQCVGTSTNGAPPSRRDPGLGTLIIHKSGTRPVYETVLGEFQSSRPRVLTEHAFTRRTYSLTDDAIQSHRTE